MKHIWGRGSWTVLGLALLAVQARGGDWPQFLGPERQGVAAVDEQVAPAFPLSGPRILWTQPLGTGFAGPVVADGKVVLHHRVDDQSLVVCLDGATGEEIWHQSATDTYQDSFGFDNGPRASPTIAGGKVILHGADGLVRALDFATGAPVWSYDTVKELQSPQGFFGRVCAPLVVEDRVILAAGGRNAAGPAGLVALGLSDGKLLWQSLDDEASYAAPILKQGHGPGGPQVVAWMRNNLSVVDAKDGAVKFKERVRSEIDASVNAATPVWCGGDRLFLTACYDVGANLWQWEPGGKLKRLWRKTEVLDVHYSTPVYHDGHLYGFHGRQEFGQSLRCIRAEDGRIMWESGRLPGGTLLRVGSTLLVLTEAGELWLVEATPEKFNRLGQEQILRGGHRSHAAFANGVLYARDDRQVVAVDLSVKGK